MERIKLRELYRQVEASPDVSEQGESKSGEARRRPESLAPPIEAAPLAPVRRIAIAGESDGASPVEVTKGYEFAPERFVSVAQEELRNIAPQTSPDMEILEFVQLSEIDPVFFETSYYVRPEPAGEKPYALLFASMRETGLVALAHFAMHRREHVVVLRPGRQGILAHTMFYTSEVRAADEYRADAGLVKKNELDLSIQLVGALKSPFDPAKFRDAYRDRLEALITSKVQNQTLTAEKQKSHARSAADITAALKESLTKLRKPPVAITIKKKKKRGAE